MDSDQDAQLSPTEWSRELEHFGLDDDEKMQASQRFHDFDSNGDELLSPEEVARLFVWMFKFRKLDANGDGALTLKEFRRLAASKLKGLPPEEVSKSKAEGQAIFRTLDVDRSKSLSASEHFDYDTGI